MTSLEPLPDGWSRSEWNQRKLADITTPEERTDAQWELLDRPTVWSDPLPGEINDPSLYALGAGEIIDP